LYQLVNRPSLGQVRVADGDFRSRTLVEPMINSLDVAPGKNLEKLEQLVALFQTIENYRPRIILRV
jgi:hypothetical protein